jgi:hypothetical protein
MAVQNFWCVFSSLALTGELICFGDYSGNVYALNNKTGKEQWHFPMGTRTFSAPLVHDGNVYCSSDDGILYALSGNVNEVAARLPAKKAVFWEGFRSDTLYHWFANDFDICIRDYFKGSDYEWVDSNALKKFMEERIADKAPSVIVFADNKVPMTVMKERNANALIRKYLDAGGKVVFLGPNPLLQI